MRKYISFLSHILLRKVSLWVIAVIYALVIAAFSIIVPTLANMPAIYPWVGDTKIVLTVMVMIAAIFSAMIAVYIFREPQEDGTELLICSKPIERSKLIMAKLITYIIFLLVFSIVPELIFLIMFAFPQFNVQSIGWLMIGFMCGNIVSMLFFGSIAALFSLKFNNIDVIVANMALVIVIGIYNTVIIATAPTPLGKMVQDKKYAASVVPYIDKNNKTKSASYFLPTSTDIASLIKIANLEGQKEIWDTAVKNSPIDILNGFNFISQLARVYWTGELEQAWYNSVSAMGIGISSDIHYSITDNVNRASQDYVNPKQIEDPENPVWLPLLVNDDDPNWTNIGKNSSPATWLDTTNVSRTDTYNLVSENQNDDPDVTFIEALIYLLPQIISLNARYNVISAETSTTYAEGNSKLFFDVSRTESEDTYTIETFFNGQQVVSARQQMVWQNLLPTEYEVDLFNDILYEILFTNKYFGPENYKIFDDDINDDTWKISLNTSGSGSTHPITNQVLFNDFFNPNREKLNINNAHDCGMEIAKFKYYAYLKLTGQAGKVINQPYESGTDDYEIKNFKYKENETSPEQSIIVPWDAYFKCVYYPQFNSLNVANMSEFRDNDFVIPILDISIKDVISQIIGQGIVPINNFTNENSKVNWLNYAFTKSIYHPKFDKNWQDFGVNRLTPTYNGNIYVQSDPGQDQRIAGTVKDNYVGSDKSRFLAYDFAANPNSSQSSVKKWSTYPTLNKYGYISRLGLMASQFLTNYVFSSYNQVYYGEINEDAKWIEEYKSIMYASHTPYFVFTWMLFNYDANTILSPGAYAAIYLAISFIFFSIAYVKFVKYDFK